jgi:hypothetical protein
MNMVSGQVSSLHSFSRPILFVENHPVMLESLPRALNRSFSGVVFDVCSSTDHALQKLTATPYQDFQVTRPVLQCYSFRARSCSIGSSPSSDSFVSH